MENLEQLFLFIEKNKNILFFYRIRTYYHYNEFLLRSISMINILIRYKYWFVCFFFWKHTIEIFKRTEWDRGKTSFYGFQIKGNPKLLHKSEPPKRKMEFYGNSITAGYAVEDTSGKDSPDSTFTNNYSIDPLRYKR